MTAPVAIEILSVLDGWLQRQRWFAGKGRAAELSVETLGTLNGESATVTLYAVTAHYDDGTAQTYQVPVSVYAGAVQGLDHALIGVTTANDESLWVYDALADRDAAQLWLLGLISPQIASGVSFECTDVSEVPLGAAAIPLSAEQSNTSVVFGQSIILKVFRQLHAGTNPDVEVHQALTANHATSIAPLVGAVSAQREGIETTLAMLQKFIPGTTGGWDLALTSVRDLLADDDLPLDSIGGELLVVDVEHAAQAGGDFAGEAERLGVAVASVHTELASALGTLPADEAWLDELVRTMNTRLEAAVEALPMLAEFEEAVRARYAEVTTLPATSLLTQRIHGDLHLGQVLRSPERWIVLDFEGEPSAPIQQRIAYDSVLRDIAGMLRSFDYAPQHHLALESSRVGRPPTESQASRAAEWTQRNSDAFCTGYSSVAGYDPRQDQALLLGYQLDKAVYEAVYESRNRPDWLTIPINALQRMVSA